MKTVTVTIPVAQTPAERARLQAEAAAVEEERLREDLAKRNRDRGLPEPKDGTLLYVGKAGSVRAATRGRAGLQFASTPIEVKVADVSKEEIARRQAQGEQVVNIDGAEQILDDANGEHLGLVLFTTKTDATGTDLDDRSEADLEAALARKRARARDGEQRITSRRKAEEERATEGTATSPTATPTTTTATDKPSKK